VSKAINIDLSSEMLSSLSYLNKLHKVMDEKFIIR